MSLEKVNQFLGKIEVGEISSNEEFEGAAQLIKKLKRAMKLADKLKKEAVDDLKKEIIKRSAPFKVAAEKAKALEAELKVALAAYQDRREGEKQKLLAQVPTRESLTALAAVELEDQPGISINKTLDYVVDDIHSLPNHLVKKTPRRREILKAIKDLAPGETINGLSVVTTDSVKVRT